MSGRRERFGPRHLPGLPPRLVVRAGDELAALQRRIEFGEGHHFVTLTRRDKCSGWKFVRMLEPRGGGQLGQRMHRRASGSCAPAPSCR